jgi:hypothetical protein
VFGWADGSVGRTSGPLVAQPHRSVGRPNGLSERVGRTHGQVLLHFEH